MDLDISRWILEFIARKVNDENLVHRLFSVLRVPCDDFHLRKTILIKRIESEVFEASVSRRTLDSLESIAEIDKSQGLLITPSMKSAYCAVAVDCTVRFIEEGGNTEGSKYFEMMETLWWKRVGRLNELGLDSQELANSREELERAISDDEVTRRLSKRNSRNAALREVRVYVNETWKTMGPTFLEVAAREQLRERRHLEANKDCSPLPAAREQVGGTSSAPICVEENAEHVNELSASRGKAKGSSYVARSTVKLPTAQSVDSRRSVSMSGSNDGDELVASRKQVRRSIHVPIQENDHVNDVASSREKAKGSSDVTMYIAKLATALSGHAPGTVKMNNTNDVNELVAPRKQVTCSRQGAIDENSVHVNDVASSREKAKGSSDVARNIAEPPTALSGDVRGSVKMNSTSDVNELVAPRKQVTCLRRGAIDENSVHVNEVAASREQAKGSSDIARLGVKFPTAKSGDAQRPVKINGCNDVNKLVALREQVRRMSRGSVKENGGHINEVDAPRQQGNGLSSNTHGEVEGKGNELPVSEKQAKESSGGARMTVGMNNTLGNELGISDRCVTRNEHHVQETLGKDKNKEAQLENITRKRKHVGGPSVRHGRAKIANVKEGDLEPSSSKVDSLHTPTVNEVREELRSSMQELHAAVKDPLPGAIQIAERVRCELASRRSSPVCIFEKQSTAHSRSSGVDKGNRTSSEVVQTNGTRSEAFQAKGTSSKAVQANGASGEAVQANGTTAEASQADRVHRGTDQGNEANAEPLQTTEGCTEVPVTCQNKADVYGDEGDGGNQHAKHQIGRPRTSLLERNHTARTYEWDDSNADMPEQQPSSSQRIRLPSPEETVVEPLPRDELTKYAGRRKRKRWSITEEDTLREAVQKFGRGNWKFILNAHRDVFQDRTEVDLKDKWRNMTK